MLLKVATRMQLCNVWTKISSGPEWRATNAFVLVPVIPRHELWSIQVVKWLNRAYLQHKLYGGIHECWRNYYVCISHKLVILNSAWIYLVFVVLNLNDDFHTSREPFLFRSHLSLGMAMGICKNVKNSIHLMVFRCQTNVDESGDRESTIADRSSSSSPMNGANQMFGSAFPKRHVRHSLCNLYKHD